MMSLNASRSRRVTDGTSSGKRGRPESVVRQYWEDIDVAGLGPKCVFCDHRSVTRLFRAPPATRHTLICKNAPQDVKDQLRRVTNNKYSRRQPLAASQQVPQDASAAAASAAAAAAAAAAASKAITLHHQPLQPHHQVHQHQHPQRTPHHQHAPPPHHQPHPSAHHPSQPHAQHHPAHHVQPPANASQPPPLHSQANPHAQQTPQPQFSFKHSSPTSTDPSAHNQDPTSIPNLSSPRHLSASVVTPLNASPTAIASAAEAAAGVPATVRSALLSDPRGTSRSMTLANPSHAVGGAALSAANADMLYATRPAAQRMLPAAADDLGGVERAHAALTAAVVEALFPPTGRKKEGAVPSPAEFRAALAELKEVVRSKAKRQRNEARAEVVRLQNAISLLVASNSGVGGGGRTVDAVESDDSEDEMGMQGGGGRRQEWGNGYDRGPK